MERFKFDIEKFKLWNIRNSLENFRLKFLSEPELSPPLYHCHSYLSEFQNNKIRSQYAWAYMNSTPIVLTEHDNIDAFINPEFDKYTNMIFPGCEFKVHDKPLKKTFEILGYFFDPKDKAIQTLADDQKRHRAEALKHYIDHLAVEFEKYEIELDFDEIAKIAYEARDKSGKPIGSLMKQHLHHYLVDVIQAFKGKAEADSFLFDVQGDVRVSDWPKVPAEICIKKIHDAGGVAVLAHPAILYTEQTRRFIRALDEFNNGFIPNEKRGFLNKIISERDRDIHINGWSRAVVHEFSELFRYMILDNKKIKIPKKYQFKTAQNYEKNLKSLIGQMVAYGIDGIETYMPMQVYRSRYPASVHKIVSNVVDYFRKNFNSKLIKTYGYDWHQGEIFEMGKVTSKKNMMKMHKQILDRTNSPSGERIKKMYGVN